MPIGPPDGDERSLLLAWLDDQRRDFEAHLDGLDDEQLVRASVPPSDLSLVGLVRHLSIMERVYLSAAMGAEPYDLIWCTDADPDADFLGLGPADVAPSMARWLDERERTDRVLATTTDLTTVASDGNGRSLRWNLQKLLAEYAGHNGHAALLREAVDGRRGD